MFTKVKTDAEIDAMRHSGQLLAVVLAKLEKELAVGQSTKELADSAARELKALGGKPAFLGYHGFPDVLCVSVNDEVVHGIPRSDHIVHDGDIVSLDFGVSYNGMITDAAISVLAGTPDAADTALVAHTERALLAGIDVVKDGVKTGTIGNAVAQVLSKDNYGIVRDLVGHGVGHHVHEDPNVPNYGQKGTGHVLHAGMTIAIEPMATHGSHLVTVDSDGWTIRTQDGSRSAHFEHTVLITEQGAEILTARS